MNDSSCSTCKAASIPCPSNQCAMWESLSVATPSGINYGLPLSWLQANANSTAAKEMGDLWNKAVSSTNGKSTPPSLRENLGAAMIFEWTNRVAAGKPVDPAFALEYIQVREGITSKTYRDYSTMIKVDVQTAASCAYELLATGSYADFEKRVRHWKAHPKHKWGAGAEKWYTAGPGGWSASSAGLISNPQYGGLLTLPGSGGGPVVTPTKLSPSAGGNGISWEEWAIVGGIVAVSAFFFWKFEI